MGSAVPRQQARYVSKLRVLTSMAMAAAPGLKRTAGGGVVGSDGRRNVRARSKVRDERWLSFRTHFVRDADLRVILC